jgi:hypothetical protein
MLIVNADDLGRNRLATDRIISCHKRGSLTSTSVMVFMEDSERAAERAKESGIDVGLHLNFSERFTLRKCGTLLLQYQDQIVRFLTRHRYSFLFYHPALRKSFCYVFEVQLQEFLRLYGRAPSHFDGHHHMHLCANMLVGGLIAKGQKVRRNFSFLPGEKSPLNRLYRSLIDRWLVRRYRCTDYLFALSPRLRSNGIDCVVELAKVSNVELETHPENSEEFDWLMGDQCIHAMSSIKMGSYAAL